MGLCDSDDLVSPNRTFNMTLVAIFGESADEVGAFGRKMKGTFPEETGHCPDSPVRRFTISGKETQRGAENTPDKYKFALLYVFCEEGAVATGTGAMIASYLTQLRYKQNSKLCDEAQNYLLRHQTNVDRGWAFVIR